MHTVRKIWKKVKLFAKECLNALSNIVIPIVSALCAIMEICQLPIKWTLAVKNVEYKLFFVSGTADKIVEYIDTAEQQIIDNIH